MGYTVVIGCDNKAIISRTSENNYRAMFLPRLASSIKNMEPLSFPITLLGITPCGSDLGFSKVVAAEQASNSPWLYGDCSSDQLSQSSIVCPPCVATPTPSDQFSFEADPLLMGGGNGVGALVDDQGRHYMMYVYRPSPGPTTYAAIMRSTDYTQEVWEIVLNLGPLGLNLVPSNIPGNQGCVFAKGYLWYIGARTNSSFSSSNDLIRIDIDGGTYQQTTIDWGVLADIDASKFDTLSSLKQFRYELSHTPGTDRIFGTNYSYANRLSDGAIKTCPIMFIDISDVDNPIVSFTSFEPFGPNIVPGYTRNFDNDIYITKAFHQTPENPTAPIGTGRHWDTGGIYRTDDGGSTWTAVKPQALNLAASTRSTTLACLPLSNFYYNSANYSYQHVAIADASTVFVVGAPPYIYRSDDQGLTWYVETVNMSIFDPGIIGPCDEAANQWTSIGICGDCPTPPRRPRLVQATLIGAT